MVTDLYKLADQLCFVDLQGMFVARSMTVEPIDSRDFEDLRWKRFN